MTGAHTLNVTVDTFQREVVERSMTTPVLLDFWAEWCGPCRTLGPVLERLAEEYGGSFVLGKVDTERERELAMAFQVQGIPFCVLVDGGRPVDAFQGALRESELRRFLQRNAIGPTAAQEAPAAAPDPDSPAARLDRARRAAGAGDAGAVREALAGIGEEDEHHDQARRLLDGLRWLEAPLAADQPGAAGLLAAARSRLVGGDVEGAMERILEAVALDKSFQQGLPRQAMLLCFAVAGEDDERVDPFRRRLATLLY